MTGVGATGVGATGVGATGVGATGVGATGLCATQGPAKALLVRLPDFLKEDHFNRMTRSIDDNSLNIVRTIRGGWAGRKTAAIVRNGG